MLLTIGIGIYFLALIGVIAWDPSNLSGRKPR